MAVETFEVCVSTHVASPISLDYGSQSIAVLPNKNAELTSHSWSQTP